MSATTKSRVFPSIFILIEYPIKKKERKKETHSSFKIFAFFEIFADELQKLNIFSSPKIKKISRNKVPLHNVSHLGCSHD